MDFKKYNSIENSYRLQFLNYLKLYGLDQGDFIIQEKIHGSNFSIWYDGKDFKVAKRSCFIGSDNFFNWQPVVEALKENIKSLYKDFFNYNDMVDNTPGVLTLYGELFGGTYPHDQVPKNNTSKTVQKGVYYSPNNEFMAFDLRHDEEFLNLEMATKLFTKHGIPHTPILHKGDFKSCMEYPNKFQSTISGILGYPEIPDNICEGVVIKPVNPTYLKGGQRVILKNKNDKWSEKEKKVGSPKEEIKLSEEQQKIYDEFKIRITENRLRNVLSKFGPVTQKDFGKVMGMFVKDIHDEVMLDFKAEYDNEPLGIQKKIGRSIGKESSILIRENFLNIIDGCF